MDIRKTRRLANLIRFSGYFKIRNQSVSSHIQSITLMALDVANRFYPELKCEILESAILHDILESSTMNPDYNYLFKRLINNYSEIEEKASIHMGFNKNPEIIENEIVRNVIEFLDILEVLYYSQEEIELGNSTFNDIYRETYKRALDCKFPHKEHYLKDLMEVEPKDLPEGLR